MTNDDPIEALDIGESTVVSNVEQVCFWGTSRADQFVGSDRQVDELEITDARFVGEPGNEGILLEIEGQVTRQLPRGAIDFPAATEPPAATQPPEPTPRWKRVGKNLLSLGIGVVVAGFVSVEIMNKLSREIMASGEPITFAPTPVDPMVGLIPVVIIALIIAVSVIGADRFNHGGRL